jgi:hypothetical protein
MEWVASSPSTALPPPSGRHDGTGDPISLEPRSGSRQAAPRRGSCGGGRRVRRLRFAARTGGRAVELTPLASRRFVQAAPESQFTKRASAPTSSPVLLAASEIAPAGYRLPRAVALAVLVPNCPDIAKARAVLAPSRTALPAKARAGGTEGASEAARSAGLGSARRGALRELTRGRCPSAALRSKRSEFDRATPSRAPQRSRPYPADRRSEALRPARTRLCRTDLGVRSNRSSGLPGRAFAAPTLAKPTSAVPPTQRLASTPRSH